MSDRHVGQSDRTVTRWTKGGVLQTDGSSFAWYTRINAGALEYLQGSSTVDDGTWSTTYHEFDLTLVTDGFDRFFSWPSSSEGYVVTEHARNTVYGLSGTKEHSIGAQNPPIDLIKKILTNKLIVDDMGLATLYDDDQTTVLRRWQINQVTGTPATADTDAMQRVPL